MGSPLQLAPSDACCSGLGVRGPATSGCLQIATWLLSPLNLCLLVLGGLSHWTYINQSRLFSLHNIWIILAQAHSSIFCFWTCKVKGRISECLLWVNYFFMSTPRLSSWFRGVLVHSCLTFWDCSLPFAPYKYRYVCIADFILVWKIESI